jgi:hypothetical protein
MKCDESHVHLVGRGSCKISGWFSQHVIGDLNDYIYIKIYIYNDVYIYIMLYNDVSSLDRMVPN